MAYEELALRFFALREDLEGYRPPLRQLLNKYMRKHRTSTPQRDSVNVFIETCDVVYQIFGAEGFRLAREGRQGAFNKALFDSIMLPLSYADRGAAASKADEIIELRTDLLDRATFQTAIGRATADRTRMHGRITAFARGLRKLGVRCDLPSLPD